MVNPNRVVLQAAASVLAVLGSSYVAESKCGILGKLASK